MTVFQKPMMHVLRGLSATPAAYAELRLAVAREAARELVVTPGNALASRFHEVGCGYGAALGTYTAIREDVINGERMDAYSAADWKTKVAYHVIGGAVTPLYFTTGGGVSIAFGDSIQRGVDTWMWEMDNEMKTHADNKADAEIADTYLSATKETDAIVSGWANGRSDIDTDTMEGKKVKNDIISEILDGQTRGSYTASKYL